MSDPIDGAIRAAQEPQQVEMVQKRITIHVTGRPCIIAVPVDLNEAEALVISGFLSRLPEQLRQESRKPHILVPRPV